MNREQEKTAVEVIIIFHEPESRAGKNREQEKIAVEAKSSDIFYKIST